MLTNSYSIFIPVVIDWLPPVRQTIDQHQIILLSAFFIFEDLIDGHQLKYNVFISYIFENVINQVDNLMFKLLESMSLSGSLYINSPVSTFTEDMIFF